MGQSQSSALKPAHLGLAVALHLAVTVALFAQWSTNLESSSPQTQWIETSFITEKPANSQTKSINAARPTEKPQELPKIESKKVLEPIKSVPSLKAESKPNLEAEPALIAETRRSEYPPTDSLPTNSLTGGQSHANSPLVSVPVAPMPASVDTQNSEKNRYFEEVLGQLNRYKRYPLALKRQKIEGVVKLTFTINTAGKVTSARVTASSGEPGLDRAALDMLERASPLPAIPSSFGQRELTLSVPISYSLIQNR